MSTTPESNKPENCQSVSCCSATACVPKTLSEPDVTQTRSDQPQNKFRISNMDCASEEAEIRRALDGISGIDALRFDLGARVLTISASEAALPGAPVSYTHLTLPTK
jgi:Cd2+/Zn2+-exporting ATPase